MAETSESVFERHFRLRERGTTVRTEILAGLTTFLTMAYISFVNPLILSDTGMDRDAVFVATCLAAGLGTLIMGLAANLPIALAPGMGLNAFFAYTVVGQMGYSWQIALGAVFLSGVLFIVISILPIRVWIIDAIPHSLKMGITVGIGFFLALIALENAGIVVDHPATLVTLGDLTQPAPALALLGFVLIVALDRLRVTGHILIGILVISVIGIAVGLSPFKGLMSTPPSLAPTLLQMDLAGAFDVALITVILSFLFVDLFDTAGTLVGVAHRGKLLDAEGRVPQLRRALLADSTATVAGAASGTSNVTSYIESAAGINAGGRTGLTAVVVAVLFILALFFAPLASSIPAYATAPALLYVACMMARSVTELDWDDVTAYAPAIVTALTMPFSYSIATGIGLGFITYVATKLLAGRWQEAGLAPCVLALAFVLKFGFL